MPVIQSIMSLGDLDLVEVRFHRPYAVDKDAVTCGGVGITNEVTLIFESKLLKLVFIDK